MDNVRFWFSTINQTKSQKISFYVVPTIFPIPFCIRDPIRPWKQTFYVAYKNWVRVSKLKVNGNKPIQGNDQGPGGSGFKLLLKRRNRYMAMRLVLQHKKRKFWKGDIWVISASKRRRSDLRKPMHFYTWTGGLPKRGSVQKSWCGRWTRAHARVCVGSAQLWVINWGLRWLQNIYLCGELPLREIKWS